MPCLPARYLAHFIAMLAPILVGASALAAFVVLGCGGSTASATGSGRPIGSGGASGTGGSGGAPECTTDSDCSYSLLCLVCPDGIDSCPTGANCVRGRCGTTYSHDCGVSNGGSTGSGGSGGNTGGMGGGASPGKAAIEFTVTGPESYCAPICPAPEIKIQDSSGHALILTELCQVDCGSCFKICPSCLNVGTAVTGFKMDWDGTVYQGSTCGAGFSCLEPTFASPGKYTATFCATPGTLAGPDGGLGICVTSGSPKCGTVTFDFPSSTVVKGTIGP